MLWKLCLQAAAPQQQQKQKRGRAIVEISSESTIGELLQVAVEQLQIIDDDQKDNIIITLKSGSIPARTIFVGGIITTTTMGEEETTDPRRAVSLAAAGLSNQDRIIVEWHKKSNDPSTTTTTTMAASSSSNNNNNNNENIHKRPQRSQRAAAKQATASMPALLAAQDAAMAAAAAVQQKTKRKNSSSISPNKRPKTTTTPAVVGKHFAALDSTPARRLKDGMAILASPSNKKKKKSQKTKSSNLLLPDSTTTSLEEGLVMHATTNKNKQAWKEAVHSAYEQNKAVARLAVTTHQIRYRIIENNTTNKNHHKKKKKKKTLLVVTFEKGVQGRGVYEDTVDYIPVDVLQAAIIGGGSNNSRNGSSNNNNAEAEQQEEEGLRPHNLALLSPRIFWNIRYHFPAATVDESLRCLWPDRDWSFLRRRRVTLSAKARENLRQVQQAEREREQQNGGSGSGDGRSIGGSTENNHDDEKNWEAAYAAITAVEDAMANHNASQPRSKRPTTTTTNGLVVATAEETTWTIVTPNETDEDELAECVRAGGGRGDDADVDETTTRRIIVQHLLAQNIHNWRELANIDATELSTALSSSASSSSSSGYNNICYNVDTVQSWIDYAQLQTMDEIMVEVCDGNEDAVVILREVARTETPRDLVLWSPMVTALHQTMMTTTASSFAATAAGWPYDVAQVARWCGRAQSALVQLPWLDEFTTAIVDDDDDDAVVGDDLA